MNIFFLHESPGYAAQMMVDKHVVKMILESAQLLSTAHRVLDGKEYIDDSGKRKVKRWKLKGVKEKELYSATHVNHPSAKWVRENALHYMWLYSHFVSLLEEYTYRYGKQHKCERMCRYLGKRPSNIDWGAFKQPPCAMDEVYIISDDAVENYRHYYMCGKSHLHQWTRRPIPQWVLEYKPKYKRKSAHASI